ncbi:ATP-binding protein [Nocardia sp. NPDC057030]|uniref:ATP-binding protein n=1 Tax=unclassified Nocardia TaxID=2637762 RepID=UPI00362BC0AE
MATHAFVGRDQELDELCSLLLGQPRLVTLVGPGGIGKTRLAAEAVQRIQKARRTPVVWVRLARLGTDAPATAVAQEITRAVLDQESADSSEWLSLVDTFTRIDAVGRPLPSMLVLDNCEHVLLGAGVVIADLLEAVPGLTILATSREPIGWTDERIVTVPPLSHAQAVELFRKRAELTGHPVEDRQLQLARQICDHMHRNPLYVQLAAGRLIRQPLSVLLHDLTGGVDDRRTRWSQGTRIGVDARHRSIADAIAWSYDLCQEKERLLLERMSTFAAGCDSNPAEITAYRRHEGGVDLAAIKSVCGDDDNATAPALATDEIEDLLYRLVDQSLVAVQRTPHAVRYFLLETIRVFARQRLEQRSAAEPQRLAARHRKYFRDKVVAAAEHWVGTAEQELLDWSRAEWDNILTAIEGSLTDPEAAALGLEISAGLIALRGPFFRGSLLETRRWTERSLAVARGSIPKQSDLYINATALICWLCQCQGDHEAAARLLDECVAACTGNADDGWRGKPHTDPNLPAAVDFAWGAELFMADGDPRAIPVLARAREKFHQLRDRGGEVRAELVEALAAGLLGPAEQALHTTQRHLDTVCAAGAAWARAGAETAAAIALAKHGNPNDALVFARSALEYQTHHADRWGAWWSVHVRTWCLARILTDLTSSGSAGRERLRALATEIARLVGGAATLRADLGGDLTTISTYTAETERAIGIARGVLGAEKYAAAAADGAALRPEFAEVQRLALGTLASGTAATQPLRRSSPMHWAELSAAEQQVAILAAAGWTNTAIAARRGSAAKTVDTQMTSIFRKLTIASREDIVRFVPEHEIHHVRTESARKPERFGTHRIPAIEAARAES